MWENKNNKRAFFSYLLKEKLNIGIVCIFLIVGVIGDTAVPLIIRNIFNVKKINFGFIMEYLAILLFVASLTAMASYLYNYLLYKTSNKISAQVQQNLVKNIVNMDSIKFEAYDKGKILNRFTNDIKAIEQMLQSIFPAIFKSLLFIVLSVSILFSMNALLSIISISILFVYVFAFSVFNKKIIKFYRNNISINDEMVECAQDVINGTNDIKSWNVITNVLNYYINIQKQYYKSKLKFNSLSTFTQQTYNFIKQLGNVIIIVLGYYLFSINKIGIGEILAFILYLNNLYAPVIDLFDASNDYNKCITNIERIFEFDQSCEYEISSKEAEKNPIDEINKIEFINVSFSYGENAVLRNISFTLEKGKRYVLVGKTGCGKSTLLNILLGLYKPKSGQIVVNNTNISFREYKNIVHKIYAILQDSYLFNRTIKENIEIYSEKEIQTLLEQSCLLELKDRLDEKIGQNGSNLSGGQKQRLLFTRVLDKKNDMLILDESTSAMDGNTEKVILENIFTQYKDSIIILCSHEQKILDYADSILKLEDKSITCIENMELEA